MLKSICRINSSVLKLSPKSRRIDVWKNHLTLRGTVTCTTNTNRGHHQARFSTSHLCQESLDGTGNVNHIEEYVDDEYDPFLDEPMELVKEVAESIRTSVREYTKHHKLKLVAITASRTFTPQKIEVDHGADTYAEWISKTCEEDGIQYRTYRVAGGLENTANQVQNLIHSANHSSHGILVYYPIYNRPHILGVDNERFSYGQNWSVEQQEKLIEKGCEDILRHNEASWPSMNYKTRDDYFRDSIPPSRDVEGLCKTYQSRSICRNQKLYVDQYNGGIIDCNDHTSDESNVVNHTIFPCTALAVVRVMKRCLKEFDPRKPVGKRFEQLKVTIINRSQIMGRPLASMLANDGATVYSVDEKSIILIKPGRKDAKKNQCSKVEKSVQECIQESSVIVTGVPSSTYRVPSQWIQPNSTVINVASEPNVNEDELREIPGIQYISQIGKVTVALLEHNLVQLHKLYHSNGNVDGNATTNTKD